MRHGLQNKAPIIVWLLDHHQYHLYICICTIFSNELLSINVIQGPWTTILKVDL